MLLWTEMISLEQYVVLYNLVDQDGINQKSLSHKVDKDQATLARILDIPGEQRLWGNDVRPKRTGGISRLHYGRGKE